MRGIEDPNEGYETITDLMRLQDQIDSFQKRTSFCPRSAGVSQALAYTSAQCGGADIASVIFAHFKGSTSNECRISALVPQVKESYGM